MLHWQEFLCVLALFALTFVIGVIWGKKLFRKVKITQRPLDDNE